MCAIDADCPELYRMNVRLARKEHRCSECSRLIAVGEKYNCAFMIYEGTPDTFRTCAHCRVGQMWLIENCGTFIHGDLIGEMQEHARDYPAVAPGLNVIVTGIKQQWRQGDILMVLPVQPAGIASHA